MNGEIYNNYVEILRTELIPALGCTEPIALAYASAKAVEVLGDFPESIKALCSGNIIKNVKGVKVPNSGGLKGVESAVILGALGGDAGRKLEVLETVSEKDRIKTKELLKSHFCTCLLKEGVPNLFIEIQALKGTDRSVVRIENSHTCITLIERNGEVIYQGDADPVKAQVDKSLLNLKDIIAFAKEVDLGEVREVLERQIAYNTAISDEGLEHEWGAGIGRMILEEFGDDVKWFRQSGNDLFPSCDRIRKRHRKISGAAPSRSLHFQPGCPGSETLYRSSFRLLRRCLCGCRSRGRHHLSVRRYTGTN